MQVLWSRLGVGSPMNARVHATSVLIAMLNGCYTWSRRVTGMKKLSVIDNRYC